MKKHKFKLDRKHWKENHRSIFDLRAITYMPRCKVCGEEDMLMQKHIIEPLRILTVKELGL